MKVIALFAAKSRVGKDEVGRLLSDRLYDAGFVTERMKVADDLKRFTHSLCKEIGVQSGAAYEINPRLRDSPLICPLTNEVLEADVVDVWIRIGEALKSVWQCGWIYKTINNIHGVAKLGVDYVIITDCREDFEIEALRSSFPTLVVEVVSDVRGVRRAMDGKVSLTPDHTITNNYESLDELADSLALSAAYTAAVQL